MGEEDLLQIHPRRINCKAQSAASPVYPDSRYHRESPARYFVQRTDVAVSKTRTYDTSDLQLFKTADMASF